MRWLPWAAFGTAVLLSTTGVALLAMAPEDALAGTDNSVSLVATFAAVMLVFGLVGAVVAARLPAHPIGWLFLVLALLDATFELAFGYAHFTLESPTGATTGAAWVSNWAARVPPPFIAAALVLFPDGRPPSHRWRWVLRLCVVMLALILVRYALAPGPLDGFPSLSNPVGLDGAPWLADIEPVLFMLVLIIAGAAALVVRFRRSHGVERQQVKWCAYAAAMIAAFMIVAGVAGLFAENGSGDSTALGFVFAALLCGVPIAAGVAILRYRLYDIDLVIRRTLVYGALSAALAAAYLGSVVIIGLAVGESDVAVAASTLAVAALFRPARARIQTAVDQRFYRRRYDAERTLEGFSARLRDELDLEALGAGLSDVVRETIQPAHVSLWLRRRP